MKTFLWAALAVVGWPALALLALTAYYSWGSLPAAVAIAVVDAVQLVTLLFRAALDRWPWQRDSEEVVTVRRGQRVYIDSRDWWIGYYRGDTHHYVCPLPCLVIRWRRR